MRVDCVLVFFSDECEKHVEEEKKKMGGEQQHAMTQEEKMSCCTPAQIEAASQRSKNSLSKCQSADSGKFQGNCAGQHDKELSSDSEGHRDSQGHIQTGHFAFKRQKHQVKSKTSKA